MFDLKMDAYVFQVMNLASVWPMSPTSPSASPNSRLVHSRPIFHFEGEFPTKYV